MNKNDFSSFIKSYVINKNLYYALGIFLAIYGLSLIMSQIGKNLSYKMIPKIFQDIAKNIENDATLMDSIGVTHITHLTTEFHFKEEDLDKDTLSFKIKFIGKKKILNYEGIVCKKGENWTEIESKISIQ